MDGIQYRLEWIANEHPSYAEYKGTYNITYWREKKSLTILAGESHILYYLHGENGEEIVSSHDEFRMALAEAALPIRQIGVL
jgi:hypothetical protein